MVLWMGDPIGPVKEEKSLSNSRQNVLALQAIDSFNLTTLKQRVPALSSGSYVEFESRLKEQGTDSSASSLLCISRT
jgi:hypothetical protein